MRTHFLFAFLAIVLFANSLPAQIEVADELQPYVDVLQTAGTSPTDFVIHTLEEVDLIIFDDALHTAVEPFECYQELIKTPSFYNQVKYIFLEVLSINKQQYIDAYLESEPESIELAYPAFQDDFSGTGWRYKTYFDLLHTIYTINKTLPIEQRLKVIAVSNPTYWSEIKTAKDVELFRKSLRSHDFHMYKTIVVAMDSFKSGKKGIFLTNTRHTYKGIKNSQNELYWNCGTFFNQWHPGKTYSIHFHNVYLFFERNETVTIKWDRIANGLWDSAFKALGNKPVAISLQDNAFGKEPYIGNHMLNVSPNQTMYDAYDAVIFLGPLEELHKSAKVDFIYTDTFKQELARRYRMLFTEEQIQEEFKEYAVTNLEELIDRTCAAEPRTLLPQAASIGPIDAWKSKRK